MGGAGGGLLASQRWLTVTGSKYRTHAALTPLYIPHITHGLYESRMVLQASTLNGMGGLLILRCIFYRYNRDWFTKPTRADWVVYI